MVTKKFLMILSVVVFVLITPFHAEAQNTLSLTTTSTSSFNAGNAVFGCPVACNNTNIPSAISPHPDTSGPIFQGDAKQALLPKIIADALPFDNQFGVGIPLGSDGTPLSSSVDLGVPGFSSGTVTFVSTPAAGGGSDNVITQTMNQTVIDGTTTVGVDQTFSILFNITSMTDPDGVLVGVANGTFSHTVDGVLTNGDFTFDGATNTFAGTNINPGFTTDGNFFTIN